MLQFDVRPASSPIVWELAVNMALDFLGVARVLINSAHNCRQKPDEGQPDASEVSIPAFCGSEVPVYDSANLTDGVAKRNPVFCLSQGIFSY